MSKELGSRNISRGVKANMNGIVINELWKIWDKVKKGKHASSMSIINLEADKSIKGLLHIKFDVQQQGFTMHTSSMGNIPASIVIISLEEEELMLLQEEASQLLNQVENT